MLITNFIPFPIITTERLVLRQVYPNDAPQVYLLRSDSRVMEFIARPPAQSEADALELIKNMNLLEAANDAVTWAITLKTDPLLIGNICFWNIAKEHYRAEVGYALLPHQHRKGIMQEALTAVLDYGFRTMRLHSVEAHVDPANTASIQLLEKNHFVREGYFKENFFYNGRFLDTAIYALLTPLKKATNNT